jgi:cytochrome c
MNDKYNKYFWFLFSLFSFLLVHLNVNAFVQPLRVSIRNDMLEAASVSEGEKIAVGCTGCHSLHKGGDEKIAPNLFGIVDSKRARSKKFKYSEAFRKQKGKRWSVNDLSDFLKDPESFAPGNKMSFPGMSDPQDRMDLIAYLTSLK